MSYPLAIVIPAYKATYLYKTLHSLSEQTDKRFNLYIFNDSSPEDIEGVINKFEKLLNFKYRRFEQNLGTISLIKQWHRCIENTGNEPWIWLLPDDDVAGVGCVKEFYEKIETPGFDFKVVRFKTVHINEQDEIIKVNNVPPIVETSFQFLIEKLNHRRNSTVAEYIFSREAFSKKSGFPKFPLAWGSDDAEWFMLGEEKGIFTCTSNVVSLRQGSLNISNDKIKYNYIKLDAIYEYFEWLYKNDYFLAQIQIKENRTEFVKSSQFYIFDFLKGYNIDLSMKRIWKYAKNNNYVWGDGFLRNVYRLIRLKINTK